MGAIVTFACNITTGLQCRMEKKHIARKQIIIPGILLASKTKNNRRDTSHGGRKLDDRLTNLAIRRFPEHPQSESRAKWLLEQNPFWRFYNYLNSSYEQSLLPVVTFCKAKQNSENSLGRSSAASSEILLCPLFINI